MPDTYTEFSALTSQRFATDGRAEQLAAKFVHEWLTEHNLDRVRVDDEHETPSYIILEGDEDPLDSDYDEINHAVGWLPKSVISNPTKPAWNPEVTVADLAAYLESIPPVALPKNIRELAAAIDPGKAQLALAHVFVALGSEQDWSSDTMQAVAEAVWPARVDTLPAIGDQDEAAVEFWTQFT